MATLSFESRLSAENLRPLLDDWLDSVGPDCWERRGGILSVHPMDVPHRVELQTPEGAAGCRLTVFTQGRWILSRYDRRVMRMLYDSVIRGSLPDLVPGRLSDLSGSLASLFFSLSAGFWGLFGCLLVLWVFLTSQIGSALQNSLPRLEVFSASLRQSDFLLDPFPDVSWVETRLADGVAGSGLVLAFIYAFLAGVVPLLAVYSCSRGRRRIVWGVTALWSVVLSCLAWIHHGGVVDAVMWLTAPWAFFPGYLLVQSWRRPCPRVSGAWGWPSVVVVTVAGVLSWGLLMSTTLPLPRFHDEVIPRILSSEAMLVVRDDLLFKTDVGRGVSAGYYNHVVPANYYLRPPLTVKLPDKTVMTCGLDESWQGALGAEHLVPFDVKPVDLMESLFEGPLDSAGKRLPTEGFELILVGADRIPDDFWPAVSVRRPELVRRILAVDGVDLVNPEIQEFLPQRMAATSKPTSKTVRTLLADALVSMQRLHDVTEFRDMAHGHGMALIQALGLSLLVLWFMTGLMSLAMGVGAPGWRRWIGIAAWLVMIWPLVESWAIPADTLKKRRQWIRDRSRTARAHMVFEQMIDDLPPLDARWRKRLEGARECFESRWTRDWMSRLPEIPALSPSDRARALATLERLLEMRFQVDYVVAHYESLPPTYDDDLGWTEFQREQLPGLVRDPDPVVAYWALKCANYADADADELWAGVESRLDDGALNVRDRAIEALWRVARPEQLTILRNHYRGPGQNEICDYVRLNAFIALFGRREALSRLETP